MSIHATVRWHLGRMRSSLQRSRFGDLGTGSVIVRPYALRGIDRIHVGDGCAIFEGAWLQCEPNGGPIHIGDHVYLGRGVHVHAIHPISIGRGCVFADEVFVTSTDHDRIDRHAVHGTGPVRIGDNVFLGQRVTVLGGVTIGDGATIGAHAVVTRDVPAGATAVGVPARVLPERA